MSPPATPAALPLQAGHRQRTKERRLGKRLLQKEHAFFRKSKINGLFTPCFHLFAEPEYAALSRAADGFYSGSDHDGLGAHCL